MSSFLQKYKRQPKLYIDLPSLGEHYPEGALQDGQATQLPVFGMTATDEITIKTPDALFTGNATAKVINSCIPSIVDPWAMPTIDIDFCLTAIRIATHGTTLPLSATCPECKTEQELELNLQNLLDQQSQKQFIKHVTIEDLTFVLKPLTYKTHTDFNVQLYQVQRQLVNIPADMAEEEKNKLAKELIETANDINIQVLIGFIDEIKDIENSERNSVEITNFFKTADSMFYNKIKKAIEETKQTWDNKDIPAKCSNEDCGHEFTAKYNLDYSHFFAQR